MKRTTTICLAAAAALVLLSASAEAALKSYGGKIDKGGKLSIDAELSGGEPIAIPEFRNKNFPANCTVTPNAALTGDVTFTPPPGLPVNGNGRFLFDDDIESDGSHLYFDGKFKNDNRKIEGELKLKIVNSGLDPDPDQTCTTKKRDYSVKRGAPGPKAAVHRAFRVTR